MLLGLVRPDAGEVLLLGRPARDPRARARVGYLPELFRYQPWLTAAEVLDLHVRLAGAAVPAEERRECLALVGLADRAGDRVGGFSKGMQQRLGLAVALVARPELVVLDEPTSALDPLGRADVRDLLLSLKARGGRRPAQLAPHRRGRAGLRPGRHPRQGPGRRLRHARRAARPARAAAAARRGRAPQAEARLAAAGELTRERGLVHRRAARRTRTPPPCRTSWPTWSASACGCTRSSPGGSASRSGCWTSSAPVRAVTHAMTARTVLTVAALTLREASRRRVLRALAGLTVVLLGAQRLGVLRLAIDAEFGALTSGEARLAASRCSTW